MQVNAVFFVSCQYPISHQTLTAFAVKNATGIEKRTNIADSHTKSGRHETQLNSTGTTTNNN